MVRDLESKVSVISVIFNLVENDRVEYFRQMLESVHTQTYKNIEHIVIDGGSRDGTLELLKEYEEKGWIKFISEPDKGIYDAMNKGAGLAAGEYLTFLNSDDYFHDPKGISKAISVVEKGFDFSYGEVITIDEVTGKKNNIKVKWLRALRNMPFPHPGMLVRKDVFEKLNGFDTQFKLVGDYDFILRLLLQGYSGVEVKERFVTFRLGGATDQYAHKHKEEMKRVYAKNYAPIAQLSEQECAMAAETYIFPFKLLKHLICGKYQNKVKVSAIWLMINSFKRKLKGSK